jgi:RNA polymerase sigma-70 factor (ECF subfamily)
MADIDQDLFRSAAHGDQAAYWELMAPYRGLVYSVAYGMLKDPEKAEDHLHDTLIHAFRTISNLRDPAKLPSWLYSTARNLALDKLRRERRVRQALNKNIDELTRVTPISEAISKEAWLSHMEECLVHLPEPFRVILGLKYMNSYTCKEIAGILDLTEGATKSRLFYARKLLREQMAKPSAANRERRHGMS